MELMKVEKRTRRLFSQLLIFIGCPGMESSRQGIISERFCDLFSPFLASLAVSKILWIQDLLKEEDPPVHMREGMAGPE
jgi:hypothetical protein